MAPTTYPDAFTKAVDFILPHEEDYARGHWGDERFVVAENVAGDTGGVTKYGIDKSSHPNVDIAHLTRDGAIAIYWKEWLFHNLDLLPTKFGIMAFDVWVNGGHASLWLQHAYNLTRPAGAPELAEDGALGPASIHALANCDQAAIIKDFIAERNARFVLLAEKDGDKKFLNGWEQRDADLTKFLQAA